MDTHLVQIINEQHSSLRYYIRSLGVDAAWVDDIAQESFLLLYKKWDELKEHEDIAAWLRVTARNRVRNEVRKKERRKNLISKYLTTLLLDFEDSFSSSSKMAKADRRRRTSLIHCLDKLTDRAQRIIQARYFQDKQAPEIAEEFEIQPALVRQVLCRSRMALAKCIKEQERPLA